MKTSLEELTDEKLMEMASKGNSDAMSHIFNRYKLRLYNFFYQMAAKKVICEELTQETFYKVIKYKNSYKGGKFSSWIFRIARNNFYDHYQNTKKTQPLESIEFALGEYDEDTLDEDIIHLMNVINTLKKEDKEIIIMNRLQKMKYDEIAEITGSSAIAVKSRVHRIIKNMRTQYFKTL